MEDLLSTAWIMLVHPRCASRIAAVSSLTREMISLSFSTLRCCSISVKTFSFSPPCTYHHHTTRRSEDARKVTETNTPTTRRINLREVLNPAAKFGIQSVPVHIVASVSSIHFFGKETADNLKEIPRRQRKKKERKKERKSEITTRGNMQSLKLAVMQVYSST